MSDKINVKEILAKYRPLPIKGSASYMAGMAAIKEIAEAIVDKCAEEAEVGRDAGQDLNGIYVEKESILKVKQMIDYE